MFTVSIFAVSISTPSVRREKLRRERDPKFWDLAFPPSIPKPARWPPCENRTCKS